MNTQNTTSQGIQKGEFALVLENGSWVKRKVIQVKTALNGQECYIVNFKYGSTNTTGTVYNHEIKKIN
jgi:hypothetical protein